MRRQTILRALLGIVVLGSIAPSGVGAGELVSVRRASIPEHFGSRDSAAPAMSADGRFVAFQSEAGNLVAGDTNNASDVFLYDRTSGSVARISVNSSGTQGNAASSQPAVSSDGRFVAFASLATNLVANDSNAAMDVFVHDRSTGATTRVSLSSSGGQALFVFGEFLESFSGMPSLSADGRYIAFVSSAYNLTTPFIDTSNAENLYADVYVRDRVSGTTERISVNSQGVRADAASTVPVISADGRFIAFESKAANVRAQPESERFSPDVFLRDRQTSTTTALTSGLALAFSPSITPDARFVTYATSGGPDFRVQQIVLLDRTQGTRTVVSLNSSGEPGDDRSDAPRISANGRFVVFQSESTNLVPGDTNNRAFQNDVFIRDLQSGQTKRVSVGTPSKQSNGNSVSAVSSANGQYIAFVSTATNLVPGDFNNSVDVLLRDRNRLTTTLVSASPADSTSPHGASQTAGPGSVSASGRYVVFASAARSLVSGDTNGVSDIFLRDRSTAQTELISASSDGTQGNADSLAATITPNGRYVAFSSAASNLVPGDTLKRTDIFLRDRTTQTTVRVSVSGSGAEATGGSFEPAISNDGRYVAFSSSASNLVPGDTNGNSDVFARDQQTGVVTRVSVGSSGAQADGISSGASISSDGRFVAFMSSAANLVPGETTFDARIYVHDRQTGKTTLVSVNPFGGPNTGSRPVLSENGGFVAYSGDQSQVFVRDLGARTTIPLMVGTQPLIGWYTDISAEGRYVAIGDLGGPISAQDTNDAEDILLWDRLTRTVVALTPLTKPAGSEAFRPESRLPSISSDGNVIAFTSVASYIAPDDLNDAEDVFVQTRPH